MSVGFFFFLTTFKISQSSISMDLSPQLWEISSSLSLLSSKTVVTYVFENYVCVSLNERTNERYKEEGISSREEEATCFKRKTVLPRNNTVHNRTRSGESNTYIHTYFGSPSKISPTMTWKLQSVQWWQPSTSAMAAAPIHAVLPHHGTASLRRFPSPAAPVRLPPRRSFVRVRASAAVDSIDTVWHVGLLM